jgi:hypothetical protein
MTMKTTLDDEADPPMVVVFTPLEGNASASHMIDKSRHLSDGTARAPSTRPTLINPLRAFATPKAHTR